MAVPKKRTSNGKSRERRMHYKIKKRAICICSHCKLKTVPHAVCVNCGFYKNRQYL